MAVKKRNIEKETLKQIEDREMKMYSLELMGEVTKDGIKKQDGVQAFFTFRDVMTRSGNELEPGSGNALYIRGR